MAGADTGGAARWIGAVTGGADIRCDGVSCTVGRPNVRGSFVTAGAAFTAGTPRGVGLSRTVGRSNECGSRVTAGAAVGVTVFIAAGAPAGAPTGGADQPCVTR